MINIIGDPGGEALYNKAVWGLSDKPGIEVRPLNRDADKAYKSAWRGTDAIPSWSWRGCEGRKALIEVYSSDAEVELFLNGISIGRNSTEEYKSCFETTYQAGTLEAVAYDIQGNETGRSSLTSAKGDLRISVCPETKAYAGKLLYVNIDICGEDGIVESNADAELTVSVAGGELLGYGSANSRTEESYLRGKFTTYRGRSQAIIRVGGGEKLEIFVQGGGMRSSSGIKISSEDAGWR